MQSYKNELELINNTAKSLVKYGDVYIGYITAELKPYSKQQKPDLEFKSRKSKNTIFVTFEILDNKINNYNEILLTAIEYKKFAIDDDSTKFVYATNINISKDWEENFLNENIILITNIEDEKSLIKQILLISTSFEH